MLYVANSEFFLGMGITVIEGYGLTETTPITNLNRPWNIKPGTVGPCVIDTTIKISDIGEILIKGPQVMMGYYKNNQATRDVFTEDGFFKTGDTGFIDGDGYLTITGRIKDIIVTSGGKNISPQNIENRLKGSRYIEQVATIGDRRKYLSALIVIAFNDLSNWARAQGIAFSSEEDLIQKKPVIEFYQNELQQHLKDFSQVEQIRNFKLLHMEWTQQTGELTPTLKVKRRVVEEKYEQQIESMYSL